MTGKQIRNKILLDVATKPYVIGPFVLGFTSSIMLWAVGSWLMAPVLFLSALLSGGAFMTVLTLCKDNLIAEAMKTVENDKKQQEENRLQAIGENFDVEEEKYFSELLSLREMLNQLRNSDADAVLLVDIIGGAQELVNSSIEMLISSDAIYDKWKTIKTRTTSKTAMKQSRQKILDNVAVNIDEITNSLTEMKSLDLHKDQSEALRLKLQRDVHVARRVKEELESFDSDLHKEQEHV